MLTWRVDKQEILRFNSNRKKGRLPACPAPPNLVDARFQNRSVSSGFGVYLDHSFEITSVLVGFAEFIILSIVETLQLAERPFGFYSIRPHSEHDLGTGNS